MNMKTTNQKCEDFPRYMDIWSADLPLDTSSAITGGRRPIIIISNDHFNRYSNLVLAIPLTAQLKRLDLPTHVLVAEKNLQKLSMTLCEQIRPLDQTLLLNRIGCITVTEVQQAIKHALALQMSLHEQDDDYPHERSSRTNGYNISNNLNKYNARKIDFNHDEKIYF